MTEVIVDRLEVVEVDHDAGQFGAILARRLKQILEQIGKRAPVQAAGERVARRQVRQFLVLLLHLGLGFLEALDHGLQLHVALLDFGDVIEGNQHALRFALGAQYRRSIDRELDGFALVRDQVELCANSGFAGVKHLDPGQLGTGFFLRHPLPVQRGGFSAEQRDRVAVDLVVKRLVGEQDLLFLVDDHDTLRQCIEGGINPLRNDRARVELLQGSEHEHEVDEEADQDKKHQQLEN